MDVEATVPHYCKKLIKVPRTRIEIITANGTTGSILIKGRRKNP